jgi:hypothetical protein
VGGTGAANPFKVHQLWQPDGTATVFEADNNGDVTINNGDLIFAAAGQISVAGAFQINATGGVVVNESGADVDFRIEGDNEQNLFFIDAGSDRAGFGTNVPSSFVQILHNYSDSNPLTGFAVSDTWLPTTTSGNVFPTAMTLLPKYDSTHTPSGGFLTAFRLFAEIEDSGVLPIRNIDLLSTNDGAGTVASIDDIVIRGPVNSGGGAITTYTAIRIAGPSAAGINRGLIQEGSSVINSFAGQLGVGIAASMSGKVHIDQSSTTGAIPVLYLDQADLSEEFIEFAATVGAGNPIDTAAIGTYYGKVRVSVAGVGFKYMPLYNS